MKDQLLSQNIPGEIICIFKTNLSNQYQLEEQRFSIPVTNTNKDLSLLLTELLKSQNDQFDKENTQAFEFLLNDDFIKGTLRSHLLKHNLSGEMIQTIYYCFGIQANKNKSIQMDDWISKINVLNKSLPNKKQSFVVALFNGNCSLFNDQNNLERELNISKNAIKAMAVTEKFENYFINGDIEQLIVCGCQDQTLKLMKLDQVQKEFQIIGQASNLQSSIESLDTNPINPSQFCSGQYSGNLKIWKLDNDAFSSINQKAGKTENKKKKVKQSISSIDSQIDIKLHSDNLSCINWFSPNLLITGSYDHTMKYFDTIKHFEVTNINCKDSIITSLSSNGTQLLSGHEDGYIKLWDIANEQKMFSKMWKPHQLWISSVKFHPVNEYLFATASYDSTVKIMDTRSDFALKTFQQENNGKVYCLEWNGEDILFGGSNSKLQSFSFV